MTQIEELKKELEIIFNENYHIQIIGSSFILLSPKYHYQTARVQSNKEYQKLLKKYNYESVLTTMYEGMSFEISKKQKTE